MLFLPLCIYSTERGLKTPLFHGVKLKTPRKLVSSTGGGRRGVAFTGLRTVSALLLHFLPVNKKKKKGGGGGMEANKNGEDKKQPAAFRDLRSLLSDAAIGNLLSSSLPPPPPFLSPSFNSG
eukprot:gene8696-6116_t